MGYYVCIGKTNYYATNGKPIYHEFVDDTFVDYMDWMVGFAKTPKELGLVYPFPTSFLDSEKRIWKFKSGEKPDNHQFNRTKEIRFHNQTEFRSRVREKLQPDTQPWGSAFMGSTWQQLKLKGIL